MDKQQLLLEQINRVNALAVANGLAPLNLGPLARMALPAAMKQVHDKNNEVIIELGGTPIPWGGPLKDPAAAAFVLDQSMSYTDTLEDEEGGGGDDRPDWVPANATHHIDFVRAFNELDAAWTAADGVVAVETLLGSDPNTDNAWGTTGYDGETLNEFGYPASSVDIGFIGSARAKIIAGATMVARYTTPVAEQGGLAYYIVAANGNDAVFFETVAGSTKRIIAGSYSGDASGQITNIINSGGAGVNVIAVTATPARGEFAANGSDPVALVFDASDWPPGELVAALLSPTGSGDAALQSITLYNALASATGLSALSETGVVNTAPTNLRASWIAVVSNETDTSASIVHANVSGGLSPESHATLFDILCDDAEGNPVTYSVTDTEGGKFALSEGGLQLVVVADLSVGEYTPVVRATNPGGLYVEQEFTITVTA